MYTACAHVQWRVRTRVDWLVWHNALLSPDEKKPTEKLFWGEKRNAHKVIPPFFFKRTSNPLSSLTVFKQLFKQSTSPIYRYILPSSEDWAIAHARTGHLKRWFFLLSNFTEQWKEMSVMNKLTTVCWRNFQSDHRNKQMLFALRCLHKSATSGTFGIAREEAIPEGLIAPEDAAQKKSLKTLAEMPGPGTFSNIIEFFWRDGFSRIHEIQVKFCVFLSFFLSLWE